MFSLKESSLLVPHVKIVSWKQGGTGSRLKYSASQAPFAEQTQAPNKS